MQPKSSNDASEHRAMKRMLWSMLRIRIVEETIADRYGDQEMRCPTHLSIGQEAIAVGVCTALRDDDWAVSSHRAHAHYLAKGGSLQAMISEIRGKSAGCSRGKGGSMHLVDLDAGFLGSTAIVANSIPVGVGAALTAQLRGSKRVTAVFFGDAAIEEGVFHEAVNFAVVRNLNVLFVCENNQYSVYSGLKVRQPSARTISSFAAGYGLPVYEEDGNDVVKVNTLASQVLNRIRSDGGPCFIEFATYRWREHCGPHFDNDLDYRSDDEVSAWMDRDPIALAVSSFGCEEGLVARWRQSLQQEVDSAFDLARQQPFPEPSEMNKHVYA